MTLIGIFGMENEEEWMDVTGKFFEGKCADSKRVIDCKVRIFGEHLELRIENLGAELVLSMWLGLWLSFRCGACFD